MTSDPLGGMDERQVVGNAILAGAYGYLLRASIQAGHSLLIQFDDETMRFKCTATAPDGMSETAYSRTLRSDEIFGEDDDDRQSLFTIAVAAQQALGNAGLELVREMQRP